MHAKERKIKINKGTEENRMSKKKLKIKTIKTKNGWKFQTKFLQNMYKSTVFFYFGFFLNIFGKLKGKKNKYFVRKRKF